MKKLFSAVFFSFLMVSPVAFMSCGDDDEEDVVNNNTQNGEQGSENNGENQGSENNGENQGSEGNGENQNQSDLLIGTWLTKDSIMIYEGFYWYEDHYQMYEKDFYYDAYVKTQGSVVTVSVSRYGYTFDGTHIRLAAYPQYSIPVTVEANKFSSATTEFTRVSGLPQEVLDKIAAGDFIDMDEDE
ncbi:MAG: hypothetical protein J6T67_07275 [Paludibacteraceae bacterium]|nr:hypothetical protein [Paludibacteraceae bacterium]MBR4713328.1 hypothetical protein [Paludibacteraceae bacterium]MBR5373703.1 hypothetical protein [Paludibacteraceae bacterium]